MALPSNVGFGTVKVSLIDVLGEPVKGKVRFAASPAYLLNATASPPVTILPKVVEVALNSGTAEVSLVATDDPDNNPVDWTYTATFALDGGAQYGPKTFALPEGSTVDLTLVADVAKSNGTLIIRGEGVPDSADALDGQVVTWDEVTGKAVWAAPTGGGGTGGAVSSVNGEVGAVVLDAADVGARPAGNVPWTDVSGAPATFPPSAHQHLVGDVTGLQGALDGKAASSHSHSIANVTGLQAAIDGKAATAHTHAVGDVSGLQAALDAKAATAHQHNASDINAGTLDAARIPDLAQSKITGLTTALAGKVAGGNGINAIVKLTQTQYDALGTKDAATLYVIDGA